MDAAAHGSKPALPARRRRMGQLRDRFAVAREDHRLALLHGANGLRQAILRFGDTAPGGQPTGEPARIMFGSNLALAVFGPDSGTCFFARSQTSCSRRFMSPTGTTRISPHLCVLGVSVCPRWARFPFCAPVSASEGGLLSDSVALCHQVRVADKSRLVRRLGQLPEAVMVKVEQAMYVTLGL